VIRKHVEMTEVMGFPTCLLAHGHWPLPRDWVDGSYIWWYPWGNEITDGQWLATAQGAMAFGFMSFVAENMEEIEESFQKVVKDIDAQMAVTYNLPETYDVDHTKHPSGWTQMCMWEVGLMRFAEQVPDCPLVRPSPRFDPWGSYLDELSTREQLDDERIEREILEASVAPKKSWWKRWRERKDT